MFKGTRIADDTFSVHLRSAEKEMLLRAIKFLGYQNGTEWFREKMRESIREAYDRRRTMSNIPDSSIDELWE